MSSSINQNMINMAELTDHILIQHSTYPSSPSLNICVRVRAYIHIYIHTQAYICVINKVVDVLISVCLSVTTVTHRKIKLVVGILAVGLKLLDAP